MVFSVVYIHCISLFSLFFNGVRCFPWFAQVVWHLEQLLTGRAGGAEVDPREGGGCPEAAHPKAPEARWGLRRAAFHCSLGQDPVVSQHPTSRVAGASLPSRHAL